jgi:hypothetical protein
MNYVTVFNAYSGELYQLQEAELVNILEGEIPLKKKPNSSCHHCHGRATIGLDKIRKIYQICPKCIYKNLHSNYTHSLNFNYINITNSNK